MKCVLASDQYEEAMCWASQFEGKATPCSRRAMLPPFRARGVALFTKRVIRGSPSQCPIDMPTNQFPYITHTSFLIHPAYTYHYILHLLSFVFYFFILVLSHSYTSEMSSCNYYLFDVMTNFAEYYQQTAQETPANDAPADTSTVEPSVPSGKDEAPVVSFM